MIYDETFSQQLDITYESVLPGQNSVDLRVKVRRISKQQRVVRDEVAWSKDQGHE